MEFKALELTKDAWEVGVAVFEEKAAVTQRHMAKIAIVLDISVNEFDE